MLSEVSHLQWKTTLKPGHLYRLGIVFEMQTVDSYNLLVYLCPLSAFGMLFCGIVTHFSELFVYSKNRAMKAPELSEGRTICRTKVIPPLENLPGLLFSFSILIS